MPSVSALTLGALEGLHMTTACPSQWTQIGVLRGVPSDHVYARCAGAADVSKRCAAASSSSPRSPCSGAAITTPLAGRNAPRIKRLPPTVVKRNCVGSSVSYLEDDVNTPTLTVGRTTYPVLLPNWRDSRLHVAAVIVTIHVLGQVQLRFQVTIPQILAAIVTCAVMEMTITFRTRRAIVWPASAMLTGSGVALILRVPSTPRGDHWSTHAWWVFAGVAAFS